MYKVKVNGNFSYEIENNSNQLLVDGKEIQIDLSKISGSSIHVLHNKQSFNTELVELNRVEKSCKIKVNGNVYEVFLEDRFDQLLKQLGLDNLAANKVSEVKAPMPGLVLKVLISDGSEVKKGDSLVVLEAMKMENILKSPADGVAKKINVKPGDKVEKNQVLIQFL
ncbi:acetyl-CoA carboxylase biotin carboxyl carrier protein subunit [Pedobacter sp. BMA]|uniref:acetyl-CoA carboxylase biotin carboxyl carrier protein subunit n=1 Tax=Pedobacter sp. BMA TaxID=1663685 RepID=UPI00064B3B97|nr:acetyl-CoA carboxylase biotin carboxyl carrier protein subunit [Pedobacter sp. BMA]KLT64100.1 carboxylesterase [Pedobacter sp. BMA]